jgi:recombinational DNA repair protein RecT
LDSLVDAVVLPGGKRYKANVLSIWATLYLPNKLRKLRVCTATEIYLHGKQNFSNYTDFNCSYRYNKMFKKCVRLTGRGKRENYTLRSFKISTFYLILLM